MANAGAQHDLPPIPTESWREDSACRYHDARLWWDSFDDMREGAATREARHAKAAAICGSCPVRKLCADSFDWRFDDGVRGGHVTPPLFAIKGSNGHDRNKRLRELLKAGVPLDDAVRAVQHKRDSRAS